MRASAVNRQFFCSNCEYKKKAVFSTNGTSSLVNEGNACLCILSCLKHLNFSWLGCVIHFVTLPYFLSCTSVVSCFWVSHNVWIELICLHFVFFLMLPQLLFWKQKLYLRPQTEQHTLEKMTYLYIYGYYWMQWIPYIISYFGLIHYLRALK